MEIFEISPWKFNVKVGDKWEIMYLKHDLDSDVSIDAFTPDELRKGLLKPKIARGTNTPRERAELLESVLMDDCQGSHCHLAN